VYNTPKQERETPEPESTPDRPSSRLGNQDYTSKDCLLQIRASWEANQNAEQSGQPYEFPYSGEVMEELKMSIQWYPTITTHNSSHSQLLPSHPSRNSSFDPGLVQFEQTAAVKSDFQEFDSISNTNRDGETVQFKIPVSIDPNNFPNGEGYNVDVMEPVLPSLETLRTYLDRAQRYGAYGFTALAEDQYMMAVSKSLHSGDEAKVRLCMKEISMFLKQDKTSDELRHSILTCRSLLRLFEEEASDISRLMRTSGMVMLADVLHRDGQLKEAKTIYTQVLSLTNLRGDSDLRRMCESSLGKILYCLWNSNEKPLREHLRTFSTLLDNELGEITLHSALSTMLDVESRFSLIELLHPCYDLSLIVNRICSLFAKQIRSRSSTFERKLRKLTMELALECSKVRWNDNADALVRIHIRFLDCLPTADWGHDKVRGYIACCTYFKDRANFEECLKTIIVAYKTLEDLVYSRISQLYRSGDRPLFNEIKSARVRIRPNTYSTTSTKSIKGLETRLGKMIAWNEAFRSGAVGQLGETYKQASEGGNISYDDGNEDSSNGGSDQQTEEESEGDSSDI
jgi:hypothetical protein